MEKNANEELNELQWSYNMSCYCSASLQPLSLCWLCPVLLPHQLEGIKATSETQESEDFFSLFCHKFPRKRQLRALVSH